MYVIYYIKRCWIPWGVIQFTLLDSLDSSQEATLAFVQPFLFVCNSTWLVTVQFQSHEHKVTPPITKNSLIRYAFYNNLLPFRGIGAPVLVVKKKKCLSADTDSAILQNLLMGRSCMFTSSICICQMNEMKTNWKAFLVVRRAAKDTPRKADKRKTHNLRMEADELSVKHLANHH